MIQILFFYSVSMWDKTHHPWRESPPWNPHMSRVERTLKKLLRQQTLAHMDMCRLPKNTESLFKLHKRDASSTARLSTIESTSVAATNLRSYFNKYVDPAQLHLPIVEKNPHLPGFRSIMVPLYHPSLTPGAPMGNSLPKGKLHDKYQA